MALFGIFDTGRTALAASMTALQVTGNNIANVNTPGYTRQEIILSVASPVSGPGGFVGSGVAVTGIKRSYNTFLQAQLFGQQQNAGRSSALNDMMSRIEQVFNEAQGAGMSSAISDFFSSWQDLSQNPGGTVERVSLLQKASTLVNVAQTMEKGVTDVLQGANDSIAGLTDDVNSLASQIASLNDQIAQQESGPGAGTANELRDKRDELLSELGDKIEISVFENQDGMVTVTAGQQTLVGATGANRLTVSTDASGDYSLVLNNVTITDRVTKGQIGGFIAARDDIRNGVLQDLRTLIASFVKEINLQHQQGYGLDGTTGNDFFSPLGLSTQDFSAGADISAGVSDLSQLTLDEYRITFDSGGNYAVTNIQTGATAASGAYVSGSAITFDGIKIVVTGPVAAGDSFTVSPLTDAIKDFGVAIADPQKVAAASDAGTVPGDGSNATATAQLEDKAITGLDTDTFDRFYRTIVQVTGVKSGAAADSLTFEENLLGSIQQSRDSASGVSLDEEAANMIRYQRSYEAAARIIKVADELAQTLLNI